MTQAVYQKSDRNRFGTKNSNWKAGKPKCLECGVETSDYGKLRCKGCYGKGISGSQHYNWKGGLPKCVDCGKSLSAKKAKRCHQCAGHHRMGRLHGRWKGGVTLQTRGLRHSNENRCWRKAVLERDERTCQLCKTIGGMLHVHHKKEWSKHKELRFEIDNGVTLCRDCHLYIVHQGAWRNPALNFWN